MSSWLLVLTMTQAMTLRTSKGPLPTRSKPSVHGPPARRILIGPLPSFTPSDTERKVIRDQEQAAASDTGAVFIDPIEEAWIPGPRSALLGPDGEHPSHQGQQFQQEWINELR